MTATNSRGMPAVPHDHLTPGGRDEPGGDIVRMPGTRAEIPGSGDPVAALNRLAGAVGEELPSHGDLIPLSVKTSANPSSGR